MQHIAGIHGIALAPVFCSGRQSNTHKKLRSGPILGQLRQTWASTGPNLNVDWGIANSEKSIEGQGEGLVPGLCLACLGLALVDVRTRVPKLNVLVPHMYAAGRKL